MEKTYVRHVELLGFEKRFSPSQHYVYMLMVKWSDLTEKLIYRRYPEFHTFHKLLKEMFPIESGQIERKDRIIPSLPAPRWLDSQKSTETRQNTLIEYCNSLVSLPPHISRSKPMANFFKVRPEDGNPPAPNTLKIKKTDMESRKLATGAVSAISGPIILDTYRVVADFAKTSKHEINLNMGDLVEIVEKNQNGWWFCQCEFKRGWVPATYLEPLDGPEETEDAEPDFEGELHVAVKGYKAALEDEISLELGETIEVIHKLLDGWWVVRRGDETGYFPSMFLHKAGKRDAERMDRQEQAPPPRRSTIRNAVSIHKKPRQRPSQETYRSNSRLYYLQQKDDHLTDSHKNTQNAAMSLLSERKNQDNIAQQSGTSPESELRKEAPVIPPRPSAELILERCSNDTRKNVGSHKSQSNSSS